MTTIVLSTKERAMASDKQVTFEGNAPFRGNYGPKIKRLTVGGQELLLATCGSVQAGVELETSIIKTIEDGDTVLNIEDKRIKKATAIVYFEDGRVHVYDGQTVPIPLEDPFFGVGSGSSYAIGALYHGASLKEAIRIACLCDPYSGFGIQYEQFSNNKGKGKGNRNRKKDRKDV
jgi:ATP-dependent protease HslVU (ClpYQ) peptidase subunit